MYFDLYEINLLQSFFNILNFSLFLLIILKSYLFTIKTENIYKNFYINFF